MRLNYYAVWLIMNILKRELVCWMKILKLKTVFHETWHNYNQACTAMCKYTEISKVARVHGERCRCSDGCGLGIVTRYYKH